MTSKNYLFVSSVIFGLVALVHLLILISGWTYKIENFEIPEWISFLTILISGFMSYKSFTYWHQKN